MNELSTAFRVQCGEIGKEQNPLETWIHQEDRYKGKVVSLHVGQVRLDDGRTAVREVVRHPGGVCVVPVIDDAVILISQFRIAIEREILELPAGRLEEGEDPESCAQRELEEEIGHRAGKMVPVPPYYVSVGYTDEKMHIFLALQLRKTGQRPERDERIRQVIIPIEEVRHRLANGEFEDSKTLIGLRELFAYLEAHPNI